MTINGNTKIIGFFGSTYKFSKMYSVYNSAFKTLNLNYIYVPFIVNKLKYAVSSISNLGIKAVGVTTPYKIRIIKYLNKLEKNAKHIGAVNVVINENGRLIGLNTDGLGALRALEEVTGIYKKNVLLIGAGGAARAICFALTDQNAQLIITNRTRKKGEQLAKKAGSRFVPIEKAKSHISEMDIIINATSVGTYPHSEKSIFEKYMFKEKQIVMDIITKPKKTKFLQLAEKKGCKIILGERMLLWQAVEKFYYYTGIKPPVNTMEKALKII